MLGMIILKACLNVHLFAAECFEQVILQKVLSDLRVLICVAICLVMECLLQTTFLPQQRRQ